MAGGEGECEVAMRAKTLDIRAAIAYDEGDVDAF